MDTKPYCPTVGMIGGGQLSRMTAQAAVALGVNFVVLAESPNDSASKVAHSLVVGKHTVKEDLRSLAALSDVITFDHEHVPEELLRQLLLAGSNLQPHPDALMFAQDKILMRKRLKEIGVEQPAFAEIETLEDAVEFAGTHGFPIVLKMSRGGYDGRGVWVVNSKSEIETIINESSSPHFRWLAEAFVPFSRELASQVARSPQGQMVTYPIVESRQVNGMCSMVISPAPELSEEISIKAQQIAMTIANELKVTGMLAVELFETPSGVLVNELAMRPHNSGHWSIDGAVTSQFENHLRAVLDLPLGDPTSTAPFTVMVNIIGGKYPDMYAAYKHCLARDPGLKVHLYGKDVRPGRKVGHVTVCSLELEDAIRRATHAADYFMGVIEE
ncbi:MAG: 5-(carboxyamino)imidazole ribonucleotide synthase [Candidatus Nanopelagicales bacterium]